ncbi:MAG TPA: gamma-glutamyltransferase, partial [Saprospiraceae bacterium]|nr:gamma-glutamyltransferase [Saprospiraceae bacterium]
LIQASEELRRDGVVINTFQALDLGLLEPVFRKAPEMKDSFFIGDRILHEGDCLHLPQLQNFLDFLTDEGARGFYEGEISKQIAKDCRDKGGFLTRRDFEDYRCHWYKPHFLPYLGHQLAIPPYPSLGGMVLSLIAHHRLEGMTMPDVMHFIQKQYPSKAEIVHAASRLHNVTYPKDMVASTRGTSHFNILDNQGNAIALTVSLGEGSGYFIPGTDMQMNNMLGETYLLPGGHFSWPQDCRMLSMMCPVMTLNEDGTPDFIGGSGGAGRIPYALSQVMEKCFREKMSLKDAVDAPRIMLHDGKYHLEKGHPEIHPAEDQAIVPWEKKSLFFGGVHAITNRGSHIETYGDPRRYGVSELLSNE